MPIPRQFIDDLNRDADIVDVIGRHVKLERKGGSHVGLCPFHNEKTPSFNVVPAKGFYHCFGCGASGSALKFLTEHVHNRNFPAAVADLAAMLGREVPREGRSYSDSKERKTLAAAAQAYADHLLESAAAKKYLSGRGLERATAERYGIGYAPADGGIKGVAEENLLLAAGLLRESDTGRRRPYFWDRIMFPIRSASGAVLGFGGRCLDGSEPKYLNSSDSPWFRKGHIVYGLAEAADDAKKRGFMIAVEGYMDVVMLAQHGIGCAVATMGTAATGSQLRQIMQRTDRLVFCFDGDSAGNRASGKALHNIMPALEDNKIVQFAFLPDGEDPDSYVGKHGSKDFLALLTGDADLRSIGDMLWHPLPTWAAAAAESKSAALRRASVLVERIDRDKAPFLYEEMYGYLAQCSGIEVANLKKAASLMPKQREPDPASLVPSAAGQRRMRPHAGFEMLACLYAMPALAQTYRSEPLLCDVRSDSELVTKIRDYLLETEHTEEDATVAAYLEKKGLFALREQLKARHRALEAAGELEEEILASRMKRFVEASKKRVSVSRSRNAQVRQAKGSSS